jgi:hypothetical protein
MVLTLPVTLAGNRTQRLVRRTPPHIERPDIRPEEASFQIKYIGVVGVLPAWMAEVVPKIQGKPAIDPS